METKGIHRLYLFIINFTICHGLFAWSWRPFRTIRLILFAMSYCFRTSIDTALLLDGDRFFPRIVVVLRGAPGNKTNQCHFGMMQWSSTFGLPVSRVLPHGQHLPIRILSGDTDAARNRNEFQEKNSYYTATVQRERFILITIPSCMGVASRRSVAFERFFVFAFDRFFV